MKVSGINSIVAKVLCILGASFLLLASQSSGKEETAVLRVLNWSGFIELDDSLDVGLPIEERSPILREFAQMNHCKVEYTEFEEPTELLRIVMTLPDYFDVIIAGRSEIEELQSIGFVAALDFEKLPNYRFLGREYIDRLGNSMSAISIPYLLGTSGIAYRNDLVKTPVTSWADFFEPHSSLKGKLALTADRNLAFSASLLSLGYSFQSQEDEELRNAAVRINRLNQAGYFGLVSSNIGLVERSLQSGDIVMAMMYSGDVLSAMERNPNLSYVVPQEGSEGYTDLMCVNRKSAHLDLAYRFLDFLLEPEIAANNSIYLNYASPNAAAVELIRERAPELIENPAIYTPESIEGKLFEMIRPKAEVSRYWGQIFR